MASMPGTSPATAVSSTITTSGLMHSAEVCAPRKPTSSSTLPTPYRVIFGLFTVSSSSAIKAQPTRLSSALATILSSPQRAKFASGQTKSPIAIPYFSTSSRLFAPISINISSNVIGCCFCFSLSAWGATEPITPEIFAPLRVRIVTRWLSIDWFHQPPMVSKRINPAPVMWVTIKPTSSICPTIATFGPRMPLRAITLPRPSKVISSAWPSRLSIKISRASCSSPLTALASQRDFSKSMFICLLHTGSFALQPPAFQNDNQRNVQRQADGQHQIKRASW